MNGTAYTYQGLDISVQQADSAISADKKNRMSNPIWTAEVSDEQSRDIDIASDELIVGWSLLQMYGPKMGNAGNMQPVLPRKTLPERLASMLLDLAQDDDRVIQGITFNDLAVALGTHRETVASVLRAFRRQGLIDFGQRRIFILDFESLHEIGGEFELPAAI